MFHGFGVGLQFACAVHLAAGGQLDHAAGVGTGDLLGVYRVYVAHLRGEDLFGHLVFDHIVDPSGAAADVAGWHVYEVQAGD